MYNIIKQTNALFGEVRFLEIEGKPYAVANDVAEKLGYARPRKAILDHCKGVLKWGILTSGGIQKMSIIPEGDIYRLIVKSKLPQAVKFESWVFDEVIPQIRKTGGYIPVKAEESNEELLARAFVIAQETLAKKDEYMINNLKTEPCT